MKKLSLGLQTFSKLIEENCVYVDKTQPIYELIQGNCIFLARPRRFGKSLLCSTLKSLFCGEKELFHGLWIDKNTDYAWPVHPVIHIDLSSVAKTNPEVLTASLMRLLDDIAQDYELESLEHTSPGEMLKELTKQLFKKMGSKNRVVLIIDEYDKPILDRIDNVDVAQAMRDVLGGFYEVIKGLDPYLRFVFITGITRFSKTSIFSGLNQLNNISMNSRYAHLVGYTQEEVGFYFQEHLQKIADIKKMSVEELKLKLRVWYNGYRFWRNQPESETDELARLYAPFSILSFLHDADFDNYWFESGTPSFLIKMLDRQKYPVELLDDLKANTSEITTFEITDMPLAPLLFQAGYATIKNYDEARQCYILDMPNYEVKDSLLKSILTVMTKHSLSTVGTEVLMLRFALESGDVDSFITKIKKFYTSIPYTITIDQEKYYQSIFFLILQLVNLRPDVEKATNVGRIDLLVDTSKTLYLFEFKLNGSAQVALDQILGMKYYEAYQGCGKKIKLVGINFSSKEKNVTEYLFQDLPNN